MPNSGSQLADDLHLLGLNQLILDFYQLLVGFLEASRPLEDLFFQVFVHSDQLMEEFHVF